MDNKYIETKIGPNWAASRHGFAHRGLGPDVTSIGHGRGRSLERAWTHQDPALALTGCDWSQFGPWAWTQLDPTNTRLRFQLVEPNHCLQT